MRENLPKGCRGKAEDGRELGCRITKRRRNIDTVGVNPDQQGAMTTIRKRKEERTTVGAYRGVVGGGHFLFRVSSEMFVTALVPPSEGANTIQ